MPPDRIPNSLIADESHLAKRLAVFGEQVNRLLFDQLAAQALSKPALAGDPSPDSLVEVRAVALTVGVLTKQSWDEGDLQLFDACWRTASRTDLFSEEFEAERHRIQHHVAAARAALRPPGRAAPTLF